MSKIFKYCLAVFMVIGAGVSYFSDIPLAEYLGLAVTFGAAGALCSNTLAKSERKDWKVYVAMCCIAVSAFGLGFCNVATESMTKLISATISVILLIAGIISGLKLSHNE